MSSYSQKQQVSVTVDADIIEKIDSLTDDREAAIAQALRLWYAKQIEDQLRKFYQNRTQADIEDEQEWFDFVEDQIEETWSADGI